ncbi:putative proteasome [Ordospora colligata]|uniref:Putative proteasome n=1 Tax=Ordospora colligata OC4 TaxID=1354746 RepID=A0A0B2UIQ9_9MICR|nr:putative proteasome [Ordospora colligata OC4]KHN68932.1 putative proteasome [Ordospora colligata OC4]TBU13966.1 putative proteasome [Ordospora colligata]TBU14155.1 putative proteasome [Ordospora colligata]TBU17824.1 putative proteasome [Ordospora colligata]
MGSQARYNMFKIFSPEGKIKQLDYIQQTTELGSTVMGLRNTRIGIMIAHNEKRSKLAEVQKKVFKIDSKTLFTFSGITNDGMHIVDYLIDENVREDVIKGRKPHFINVFDELLKDTFERTVIDGRRLYGVAGLYMTEYEGKIRLVEFNPQGSAKEVHGMSIGCRCQSSRTVLEAHCGEYEGMGVEELVRIGIMALRNAHPEEDALNAENVEIWVVEVGKETYTADSGMFLN